MRSLGVAWPTRMRVRLILWLSSLLTVVLVTSSIYDYRSTVDPILSAHDQTLLDGVVLLSGYLNVDEAGFRFDLPPRVANSLRSDQQELLRYRVLDPAGETLGGDPSLPAGPGLQPREFYEAHGAPGPVRVLSQTIGTTGGECRILVAETLASRRAVERRVLWSRVVVDASVLGLTLLVVWLVIGAVTRPLERLARQVQTRSGEDLRPLPERGVPGEVQPLVRALNTLFTQIADTRDAQRRFIENAAHQLRTPMAGLKGQVELVLAEARRLLGRDSESAQRLDRIQQATDRLSHLANQMLTLSRSDRSSHDLASRRRVDLVALVDDALSGCLDLALDKGQDLGAETSPAELRGVAWELRELLVNLIDNAIRYTQAGSRITVRCGVVDGRPYLEVEDDGAGIAPEERPRVFERFYRIPGSAAGGSGLGLAIVKEIASLYGGSVAIDEPPAGGTRVRVTFQTSGAG
jgi:two-component system sensor histidine kinase TctE